MENSLDQCLKGNRVFLVAEAGATHTGLRSAMNLARIAKDAGFDAVKYQIVEADKCPHPDELFNGHRCYDIWEQRELSELEWRELKNYCNEIDIYSFTTITDAKHITWFPSFMYKIRARDCNDKKLINMASIGCEYVQVDVKSSETIEKLWIIENIEPNQLIINHCPIGYPAKPEDEQLMRILIYQDYGFKVGYSSHTERIDTELMALALGVHILEKPIMEFDSKSISPEAVYALEPNEAAVWTYRIREAEKALGRA